MLRTSANVPRQRKEKFWKIARRNQDTRNRKKSYHRNVIKIKVHVMNVKGQEEQVDMEISEKKDDTACNI